MKTKTALILIPIAISATLSGCYKSCAVGDPLGLLTYCPKENYEKLFRPKPYLHYWEKPGATEEIRRQDSLACGTANTPYAIENVVFPSPPSGRHSDEEYKGLFYSWERCMVQRGYQFTGKCYDNEIGRRKPACAGRVLEPLPLTR